MRTTHRILLRIWYDPGCDIKQTIIEYLNRGARNNCSIINGSDIIRLENRYIIIKGDKDPKDEKFIPYHRILWIKYNGKMIWSKDFLNDSEFD